jgi:hypothetical protein
VILPADIGRATVILDKDEYRSKMLELLNDETTYQKLKSDPTLKYKRELVALLQSWQRAEPIPMPLYYKIYPNTEEVPKLYGTPKNP